MIEWKRVSAWTTFLGFSWALFSGCSKEESGYYEAETLAADAPPSEAPAAVDPSDPLPPGHPPLDTAAPAMGTNGMAMGTLPTDMIGTGDSPSWTLPEGWTETEPGAMRRANFVIGESGLEVAVTSFPGTVGGLPANINRWRGQLGLPPLPQSEMLSFVTELTVDGQGVLVVDLLGPPQAEGPSQRMLSGVTTYLGSSWFFKMTGDAPLIEKHRPAYLGFLQSLRFTEQNATPAP